MSVRRFAFLMLNRLAAVVAMLAGSVSVLAQTRVYELPP